MMSEQNDETSQEALPTGAPPAPAPAAAPVVAPQHPTARLAVVSFGLALGITCALFVFIVCMSAMLFDWGMLFVQIMSSLYIGYMPTFVGSVAGGVWAFVDGLIAGMLIAWLYNKIVTRRR